MSANTTILGADQFSRVIAMLLVAGTCLLTGCASMEAGRHTSFMIKVVDENNNQPIPGVNAVWKEDLNDLVFGHYQIGPTNLQPSNDAGMIKIIPVRENMRGCLTLTRPGGAMLYCVHVSGQLGYSEGIAFTIPDDGFYLSNFSNEAVWTNGCFVVPMPRDAQ